jgi:phosphoribosylanthranilate isomerase
MALKTKVKVGKINNLSDARYCAGMGVDLLGFAVGGPDGIPFEKFTEINGWVTGPELVLEINSPENIEEVIEKFQGSYIEVDISVLPLLKETVDLSIIVRVDLNDWKEIADSLQAMKKSIRFLIVKGYLDTSIKVIREVAKSYPLLIEIEDTETDVNELLDLPIAGIALTGTDELKPGLKDYQQLSGILEKLEVD